MAKRKLSSVDGSGTWDTELTQVFELFREHGGYAETAFKNIPTGGGFVMRCVPLKTFVEKVCQHWMPGTEKEQAKVRYTVPEGKIVASYPDRDNIEVMDVEELPNGYEIVTLDTSGVSEFRGVFVARKDVAKRIKEIEQQVESLSVELDNLIRS